MVLHLSSQNTEDHFSKLRRLVDLDRVLSAHEVDWGAIVTDAKRGGLEAAVALSLQLSHHLLGTSIPSDLTQRLGVGRTAQAALALLEPVSGVARGSGPRRGLGAFLQEIWLASGAARAQHLRRLMAGEEEPLDWVWQGADDPEAARAGRGSGTRLVLSLLLYQCWIALCAPLALANDAGRRDLGIWRGRP
jgi:hypothetical protein